MYVLHVRLLCNDTRVRERLTCGAAALTESETRSEGAKCEVRGETDRIREAQSAMGTSHCRDYGTHSHRGDDSMTCGRRPDDRRHQPASLARCGIAGGEAHTHARSFHAGRAPQRLQGLSFRQTIAHIRTTATKSLRHIPQLQTNATRVAMHQQTRSGCSHSEARPRRLPVPNLLECSLQELDITCNI